MVKEFKITSLSSETTHSDQYGDGEKWIVNGKADSFKGKWNSGWKVGDMVKADIVKKNYNGVEYTHLKCPPELRKQGGFGGEDIKIINAKLDKILAILEKADQNEDVDLNEQGGEDEFAVSAEKQEVNVDSIPF